MTIGFPWFSRNLLWRGRTRCFRRSRSLVLPTPAPAGILHLSACWCDGRVPSPAWLTLQEGRPCAQFPSVFYPQLEGARQLLRKGCWTFKGLGQNDLKMNLDTAHRCLGSCGKGGVGDRPNSVPTDRGQVRKTKGRIGNENFLSVNKSPSLSLWRFWGWRLLLCFLVQTTASPAQQQQRWCEVPIRSTSKTYSLWNCWQEGLRMKIQPAAGPTRSPSWILLPLSSPCASARSWTLAVL